MDVALMKDEIKVERGRLPEKDYEVMVNKKNEESMLINKEISERVNNKS